MSRGAIAWPTHLAIEVGLSPEMATQKTFLEATLPASYLQPFLYRHMTLN